MGTLVNQHPKYNVCLWTAMLVFRARLIQNYMYYSCFIKASSMYIWCNSYIHHLTGLKFCSDVLQVLWKGKRRKIDSPGWGVLDLVHYQYTAQIFSPWVWKQTYSRWTDFINYLYWGQIQTCIKWVFWSSPRWCLDYSCFNQRNIVLPHAQRLQRLTENWRRKLLLLVKTQLVLQRKKGCW